MKLILTYRGPLKSNGNATHKDQLRRHFSPQIKMATTVFHGIQESKVYTCFFTARGEKKYFQLINTPFHTLADIHILMLRQGPQGGLVKGADIDNRLKTLLDSLTVPDAQQASKLESEQKLLYCLLEDDKLISSLAIDSEPLLNIPKDAGDDYVELIITVRTRFTRVTIENIAFA